MSLDISAVAYAIRTRLNQGRWAKLGQPPIKLTHIQECIAAALGHNTLASLQRSQELAIPTRGHYLVLDMDRVGRRSQALGLPLDEGHWSEPGTLSGFQQILLESFADDFDGIDVYPMGDALHERIQNWIEDRILNDADVSGQMAMANHNGMTDISMPLEIDLAAIEPEFSAQTYQMEGAVYLSPDENRLYTGHVVKISATLRVSKPSRALLGFKFHVDYARLTDGTDATNDDDAPTLSQPVDLGPGSDPMRLEFVLAELLDVDLAVADDLANATLNARFDAEGNVSGYEFEFKGVKLDEDAEEQLRSVLPGLTLLVTPAWLDNILLNRKVKAGDGRERYYFHGDEAEEQAGQFRCKICGGFSDVEHFKDHPDANNVRRYDEDVSWWLSRPARWKVGQRRPQTPANLFAEPAKQMKESREASRSDFHRWLEGQVTRNDVVGDFARDAMSDREFPAAESEIGRLKHYLQMTAWASSAAREAFAEAWGEYKIAGRKRLTEENA
jgi:uncharacterized protein YozE (UPF0346 family)